MIPLPQHCQPWSDLVGNRSQCYHSHPIAGVKQKHYQFSAIFPRQEELEKFYPGFVSSINPFPSWPSVTRYTYLQLHKTRKIIENKAEPQPRPQGPLLTQTGGSEKPPAKAAKWLKKFVRI